MQHLNPKKAASIVADSGGRVVGRTRLQKIAYLLKALGLDESFSFTYKHYGPYSDGLAASAEIASLLGDLSEEFQQSSWGGKYSIFTAGSESTANPVRKSVCQIANRSDAVVLELAATAVFLAHEGFSAPWNETQRRKPEKATRENIIGAKELVKQLGQIEVPVQFPQTV